MAIVLEIITGALIELGARQLEASTPSAKEAERGLTVLQGLYRDAVEMGIFGRLSDYLATADYEAKEQQRVYSAGHTITLPSTITEEDGLAVEERKPRDLAMIQVVNAATAAQINIYDASLGAWVRIDNLALSSDCPFGARNRHGLECALARRLATSLQKAVPATTSAYANGLASVLSNRLSAPRVATQVDFF